MKKILFLFMSMTVVAFTASAQWSTNANGDAYISKKVGIWNSSPSALLHITNPFYTTALLIGNSDDPNVWKYQMTLNTSSNFFRVGKVAPGQPPLMGNGSIGLGDEVVASGYTSFAAGRQCSAVGTNSVALTFGTANGPASLAWGLFAVSDGSNSNAMGKNAYASATSSVAIGENTAATAQNSIAIGYGAQASNTAAVALGSSKAQGIYSSALGNSTAVGDYSFATSGGKSTGMYSASFNQAWANANGATAFGKSIADAEMSFAAGTAYAHGQYSSSFGESEALGDYSFSSGIRSQADGYASTALGSYVYASGKNSMILGTGDVPNLSSLTNKIDNSLMIGFGSVKLPSVFVGPADPKNEKAQFGFVGIGTTTPKYELSVNGTIVAKSAVLVENLPGEWPDYVFKKDYSLMPLGEVEKFIESNHHLPGVPSQEEIKKEGLNLGEMEMIMMKKIEELTLHMIQMQKENAALKSMVKELQTKE